jgi:hypothetical protein
VKSGSPFFDGIFFVVWRKCLVNVITINIFPGFVDPYWIALESKNNGK